MTGRAASSDAVQIVVEVRVTASLEVPKGRSGGIGPLRAASGIDVECGSACWPPSASPRIGAHGDARLALAPFDPEADAAAAGVSTTAPAEAAASLAALFEGMASLLAEASRR
jgi:hypothetical protein